MRERGIILQPWEVRAILDGRKQRLTRIVKPQPESVFEPEEGFVNMNQSGYLYGHQRHLGMGNSEEVEEVRFPLRSPLGQPGDRLYGKETWAVGSIYDGAPARDIPECGVRYAATDSRLGIKDRPSQHMPRWASRILLEVTEVRVQRVQDITEEEARSEGCCGVDGDEHFVWPGRSSAPCPRAHFATLWNRKHGPGAWDRNDWVFAATVKRLEVDRG